jgi:hypothetical protein
MLSRPSDPEIYDTGLMRCAIPADRPMGDQRPKTRSAEAVTRTNPSHQNPDQWSVHHLSPFPTHQPQTTEPRAPAAARAGEQADCPTRYPISNEGRAHTWRRPKRMQRRSTYHELRIHELCPRCGAGLRHEQSAGEGFLVPR